MQHGSKAGEEEKKIKSNKPDMFYSSEFGGEEGRGSNYAGLSTNFCQLLHHFLKEQVGFIL